jgi:hypothetical protein
MDVLAARVAPQAEVEFLRPALLEFVQLIAELI